MIVNVINQDFIVSAFVFKNSQLYLAQNEIKNILEEGKILEASP